ncbi:MAG: flagellar basal body-associated FliL family protein [Melioribacteraceae bacterium]|nr:flagellar basal body-associated FliL family protein [Melioribacteraceae bacterium]
MADEKGQEKPQAEPEVKSSKKGGLSPKVFIIGIPLFVIQLVLVYFVTGYIYNQKHGPVYGDEGNAHGTATEHVEEESEEEEGGGAHGGEGGGGVNNIVSIEDIILNPAGTNGQVIMLVSVGFDMKNAAMKTAVEEQEVLVRDLIISTLAQKGLQELSDYSFRDSLKVELSHKLVERFEQVEVNHVYFPKYIIQ